MSRFGMPRLRRFAGWRRLGVAGFVAVRLLSPTLAEGAALFEDAGAAAGLHAVPGSPGKTWRLADGVQPWTWRAGERWTVPGDDGVQTLVIDDVRGTDAGWTKVRAHPEGEPGTEVMLVLDGETASGTWRSLRDGAGRILPLGGRRHRWTAPEDDAAPRCGNGPEAGAHGALARRLMAPGAAAGGAAATTTNVLDVAFVYTPAAEAGAGGVRGLEALVELAVWESNDAYARSDTALQLRRVACRRVEYAESGDLGGDLGRLTAETDGFLDDVHRLRNEVAADVVCLVVESEASNRFAGMANGLAGLDPASLSKGFTACLRPYLVGNFTLAHEVGHLLGCAHDRENAGGTGLEPWSYGTRIVVDGAQYRTVMAYRPGLQFPHFSNPRVTFRGVPTGVAAGAAAADNARTIRTVGPLLASVRTPGIRIGFSTGELVVSERAGQARVTVRREGQRARVTCRWRALDGSARAGVDYRAAGGELTFAEGQTEAEVAFDLLDNARPDGSRRATLRLESPSAGTALGPHAEVSVTVTDDEQDAAAPLDARFRVVPGADHGVRVVARDATGRVYAGGPFGSIGGRPRPRLARFSSTGAIDETFDPEVKYQVNALAFLSEGRVALGGEFNTVDGVRLNHVAILRPDGTPDPRFEFDTGTDWPVLAMLAQPDGKLVIGGRFTTVQGVAALRTARLLPTGAPDPAYNARLGPDGEVRCLAWGPNASVFLGGSFGAIAGRARPGLGRLNADGTPDQAFGPDGTADGAVEALWRDALGRLWVGGGFRRFLGRPVSGLARLTADGKWDPAFVSGSGVNDAVLAFAPAGEGRVWIGGRFTEVQGRPRNRIARLLADGAVDPAWDPGLGANDAVLSLVESDGGGVLAGGMFTEINGVARSGVGACLPGHPGPARILQVTQRGSRIRWPLDLDFGQPHVVEATSDGTTWEDVGEIPVDALPAALEVDATGAPGRWFRLRRKLD